MSQFFESWKKYIGEGEVIDLEKYRQQRETPLPPAPELPEPDIDPEMEQTLKLVNTIEDQLATRLAETYGNIVGIPIDKLEQLDIAMEEIEKLFDLNENEQV